MAFLKLDTGILDSTLWDNRDERDVFLTALLLAEPFEVMRDTPALNIRNIEPSGFIVPAGWYGLIRAAGVGIIRRSLVDSTEDGMIALEKLSQPDMESRTADHEGRRMVRIDGGFVVLNFMKFRDRDHTAPARSQRYRERQKAMKSAASRRDVTPALRDVTQADADADAEDITKQPLPARAAAPPLVLVADEPKPKRVRKKAPDDLPPKFPHFPPAVCADGWEAWKLHAGDVNFGRFRAAFAGYFDRPEPERPERALRDVEFRPALELYLDATIGTTEVSFGSVERCAERLSRIVTTLRGSQDRTGRTDSARHLLGFTKAKIS